MTLTEFQEKCRRTQNHDLPHEEQLTNATMGLTGEVLEYIHDFTTGREPSILVLELGDVLFYAAWLADLANLDLAELHKTGEHFKPGLDLEEYGATPAEQALQFTRNAGLISEVVKKHRYHGNRTLEQVHQVIASQLPLLLTRLERLLPDGTTIEEAAAQNHKKLLERYPNGFTPTPA